MDLEELRRHLTQKFGRHDPRTKRRTNPPMTAEQKEALRRFLEQRLRPAKAER